MAVAETSLEARKSVEPYIPSMKQRVFDFIFDRGARGATTDEIEVELKLSHQTASARITELSFEGYIRRQYVKATYEMVKRPTRSGRQAFVYEIVPGMYYGI